MGRSHVLARGLVTMKIDFVSFLHMVSAVQIKKKTVLASVQSVIPNIQRITFWPDTSASRNTFSPRRLLRPGIGHGHRFDIERIVYV